MLLDSFFFYLPSFTPRVFFPFCSRPNPSAAILTPAYTTLHKFSPCQRLLYTTQTLYSLSVPPSYQF